MWKSSGMATLISSDSESERGRRTWELQVIIESIHQPDWREENLSLGDHSFLSRIEEVHQKGVAPKAEFYLLFLSQKVVYVPITH